MDISSTNAGDASFVLVALASLPAIWRLGKAPWRVNVPNPPPVLYEDEDGVATEESTARFSQKPPLVTASVAVGLGTAASFALAVFDTVRAQALTVQLWLLFAAWVGLTCVESRGNLC